MAGRLQGRICCTSLIPPGCAFYANPTLVVATVRGIVSWVRYDNKPPGWFGPAGYKNSNSQELGSAFVHGGKINGGTDAFFYSDMPGEPSLPYPESIRTVWVVQNTINIDRANPTINVGDSDEYQCGPSDVTPES